MSNVECPQYGPTQAGIAEHPTKQVSDPDLDDSGLRKYMSETFYELLPLLLRFENTEADRNVNFNRHAGFAMQIAHTGLCMAGIDCDLSDAQTTLIRDVWFELSGGVLDPQFSLTQLQDIYRKASEDPPVRGSLNEIPFSLQLIMNYDRHHGTDYGANAKAMLFRFADAMVKIDGPVSVDEMSALSKYRELLDSAIADPFIVRNTPLIPFLNEITLGSYAVVTNLPS